MTIECKVNGHTYTTSPLYFEEFTKLGYISEEKIYPLLICFLACIRDNFQDLEMFHALYKASKDVFNREDLKYISNLVLNREHLLIDGKKLDQADWEKHWQKAGFVEYRIVVIKFIEANLGNFTSLSALLPEELTTAIRNYIERTYSILFAGQKLHDLK